MSKVSFLAIGNDCVARRYRFSVPLTYTRAIMGAIHKMAPVGVCGALLHTGACWMYGWLRAAEKNSPSERYFLLLLLRYGSGDT